MTRKLLVGAVVAGALAVTAGTALAISSNDQPSPSAATSTTATSTTSPTSTTAPPSSPSSPTSSTSTTTSPTSSAAGAPPAGQLSGDDAARLVRERMGGTVHEVEREVEHGRLEWKVEITARDGSTYDVRVDAATGDFTRVEQDDRDGGGRDDDWDGDGDGDRHGDEGDDDRSGRGGGDDKGGDDHDDD